jgi:hypothetical protein
MNTHYLISIVTIVSKPTKKDSKHAQIYAVSINYIRTGTRVRPTDDCATTSPHLHIRTL